MAVNSELQERVEALEARNRRVEADKAWEVSWGRRGAIMVLTYIVVVFYLRFVVHINPWINALVPVIGFFLSTQTVSLLKKRVAGAAQPVKHLYFVRHGESEHNAAGRWSGQIETPLTAKGRAQAQLAGGHAKTLHIDRIIASPYERARHTAQIIAQEIDYPLDKIELNNLLVERHFGVMEGQPIGLDLNSDGFVDVETRDSVVARARLALEYVQSLEADNVLVASHGSLGRAIRHILNPDAPFIPGDATTRFPNGEIVQLV